MEQKIESLSETMFQLSENVAEVEDNLEELKNNIETLKTSFEGIKNGAQTDEKLDSHIKEIESLNKKISDFEIRFNKMEKNLSSIAGSGMIEHIGNRIQIKELLKQEIKRHQMILISIVLLCALLSIAFFVVVFPANASSMGLLIYVVAILPFIIALFIINNGLKKLIIDEKTTIDKPKPAPLKSHSSAHTSAIEPSDMEVKSPFE